MEISWDEKRTTEEEPLFKNTEKKGGFKTMPFIIGMGALEQMATLGLMSNMILYLTKEYNMEVTTASNLLFFNGAASSFLPLVGAVIADSFLGRFHTIGFGSIICLMGLILLWSTAVIPQARPPPCDQSNGTCKSPTIFQYAYLCASFGLIAIGAGGIGSSTLAFGANQLENVDLQRSSGVKERYFSWGYASSGVSVLISFTFVVYIQDKMGWGIGFAVPPTLMLLGVILFYSGSPFYVKLKSERNIAIGLLQVAVASYRNRHLKLSGNGDTMYHHGNGSSIVIPSRKLRFLNKACVVVDPQKDLNRDGTSTNPWSLCTVDQVEELKALLKVVPIWSTGMIMAVNMIQNSFPILQAQSTNRHITSNFTIPAASFVIFTIVSVIIWIVLYDRVFLPLASRVMRRPVRLSTKTRMGIGIFLSSSAMLVTAVVEHIRRGLAVPMSALWLLPQHCLSGFADGSSIIAQNEFYFSEFPRSMSSIATNLIGIGMSLGGLLAGLILNLVDRISKAGGHESWISTDINKGRYDYYYLVLTALSMANLIYFVVCSNAYGPLKEESKLGEEEEGEL